MKRDICSIRLHLWQKLEDYLALLLNTLDDEAIQTCLKSTVICKK